MNGQPVAALKKVGTLQRTTTPITYTDATTGVEVKMPGNTKISSLTLERGLTRDEGFIEWADLVFSSKDPYEKEGFKRDLMLEVLNSQGHVEHRWLLEGCWPSEIKANPDLDSETNAIAIESLTIQFDAMYKQEVPATKS